MKARHLVRVISTLLLATMLIAGDFFWTMRVSMQDVSAGGTQTEHKPETEGESASTEEESRSEEESRPEDKKITLMMVGDNLMHMGIVNTGKKKDGTYDYSFLFESISEYLSYADIKMINQETIFGGNSLGFSGYPRFNSPTEVGDAIAEAGFNVVLHASNHCADQGIAGISHCIDFWKNHPEVLMTGLYENPDEENQQIALLTIEDVTFAILNYTYGVNSGSLDKSIRGHLGMLSAWNATNGKTDYSSLNQKVLSDIKTAKQLADVVIVCPHWGTEYSTVPSHTQEKFAKEMTEAGADLIIGTHPHVVQPVTWVESENGNRALCYYSLGNYVSTQRKGITMLEAMAWVTFIKGENGVQIAEESTGVIPMVCHYTYSPTRLEAVYFLDTYTEELAAAHGIHGYGGVDLKLSDLQKWSNEILGEWVLNSKEVLK